MDTVRIPLTSTIESRAASIAKDALITNGYIESDGPKKWLIKRPGTVKLIANPTYTGAAQGMFPWAGNLYAVIGANFVKITPAGVETLIGAVSSGQMYFNVTDATPYIFFHKKTAAWTYNVTTNTLAAVTDVDFPTNAGMTLVPGIVYLDEYAYVMTTTGRIYNSANENPTSWGALDYVTKYSEPDGGVAICKHLNYIIAFGAWSSEFFYNAGNPTGSPLLRNDAAKCEIGCASGDSVVQFSQTVAFLGQSKEAGRGVYLFEGVSPVKISNPYVERYLNASDLSLVRAMALTISGHTFYTLTLNDLGMTLVYDMNEKLWYHWATPLGGAIDPIYYCDPTYMDMTYVDLVPARESTNFNFQNHCAINGVMYMQDITNGYVVKLDSSVYVDDEGIMEFLVRTPLIDGGNNRNKFWSSLQLIGDRTAVDMDVRWSDDDYQTWSTSRTISMNQERPILWQLGAARRRAVQLSSLSDAPIRLQELEVAVKQGIV